MLPLPTFQPSIHVVLVVVELFHVCNTHIMFKIPKTNVFGVMWGMEIYKCVWSDVGNGDLPASHRVDVTSNKSFLLCRVQTPQPLISDEPGGWKLLCAFSSGFCLHAAFIVSLPTYH